MPGVVESMGNLDSVGAEPMANEEKFEELEQRNAAAMLGGGAGRAMADLFPLGEFVSLPGIGHAPFFSNPQDIASRIREFC